MKICKDHWEACRKAVHDRGMDHLVSNSGEEAHANAIKELMGEPVPFDPLMALNWNLIGHVLELSGFDYMGVRPEEKDGMPENDGQYCPMCIVRRDYDAHNTATGRCGRAECIIVVKPGEVPWDEDNITSCADAMRAHAVKLGLLKVS